jgi:hypothetical protein
MQRWARLERSSCDGWQVKFGPSARISAGCLRWQQMHPGVKDELVCRGFVCRTLHRLGLNVETIKPNGRPAVGIGWVPPEHAD